METLKYFIRRNKNEAVTCIFAILGYFISYILIKPGAQQDYSASASASELSLFLNILITFVATVIIIYFKTREKDFYFVSLKNPGHKEDWIGEGVFQYDRVHNAYIITDSYSGFIYSKCLTWSDYVVNFNFKILDTSIGVILRATNLSNLVMLQIFEGSIKPHIRVNGLWHWQKPEEVNLTFEENLSLDEWYRGCFQCDKGSIRIRIYDQSNNLVIDRVWKIPVGSIPFTPPKLPEGVTRGIIVEQAIRSITFPINLEYGTVGFRNNGNEKAIIKSFFIEKLEGAGNSI